MLKRIGLAVIATAMTLFLCPAPAGAQTTVPEEPAMLRPGDLVRIAVWQRPDYNGEFMVAADGTLSHPLFQTVPVAGVPLSVAKERLETLLRRYEKEPLVILEPLLQVSVLGEVRQPNVYALPRPTTVAQAIARAGGPTENARTKKVLLLRGDREINIDLNDPQSNNAILPIRSGDQIVLRHKGNFLRDVLMPFASFTAATVSVVVALRQ